MALNFPDSPTLNQVYTDATSGFSYQWDGYVWQSYTPSATKNILIIDDISASFNGSTQTFALASSGDALTPVNAQQLRVVLGGIVQEPVTDYTVSGSNITFTTAPGSGLDCSIVSLGPAIPLSTILDGTVTPAKLSTGGPSWNTSGDVYIAGITTIVNASGKVIAGIGTTALIVEGNARVTGILTVGTSSITLDGTTDTITTGTLNATTITGAVTGNATGLTGTPDIAVRNITGVAATFTGNVSIAGTLTYEDVTNVDSVGLITARSGIVVSSGVITAPAGSLSAPSYTFSGDSNTGLYSPGADQVTLVTGGTGRIAVDASGNVNIDSGTVYVDAANNRFGVGTVSPGTSLHISGTQGDNSTLYITSTDLGANNGGIISIGGAYDGSGNTTTFAQIKALKDNANVGDYGGSLAFFNRVGAGGLTEKARIDSSGNFGIKTQIPNRSLEVNAGNGTNNTTLPALRLKTGSVAGALGYGTGLEYTLQASNNSEFVSAKIESTYTDATNFAGDLRLYTTNVGNSLGERFRIGSAGQLGVAGANYGSSGQVLTSQGSGSAPQWATPAGGAWTYISSVTASSSATVDITSGINSTYDVYMLTITNMIPNSTGYPLIMRTSSNGGSSYDNAGTDYGWTVNYLIFTSGSTHTGSSSATTSAIHIGNASYGGNVSTSDGGKGLNAIIYIYKPSRADNCLFDISTVQQNTPIGGTTVFCKTEGMGVRRGSSAVNALRFSMSDAANINSGVFRLYGLKNS